MSENSGIQWTTHTFNPWWGCAKVSPGCDNCYAERDSKRYGFDLWGVGANRRTFGDKHWNEPLKWDRASANGGQRARVFCASMADVFDKDAPPGARERLWGLIRATPNLDWQILTKRIGNAPKMLPEDWGDGYHNVWLGASLVNREEMLRDAEKLLAVPAAVHFWSYEPALGPLGEIPQTLFPDWVIVGGESGHSARPFLAEWAQSIVAQCAAAGVACFVKQLGSYPILDARYDRSLPGWSRKLRDRKGGDMDEWPEGLRVREFPGAPQAREGTPQPEDTQGQREKV